MPCFCCKNKLINISFSHINQNVTNDTKETKHQSRDENVFLREVPALYLFRNWNPENVTGLLAGSLS